MKITKIPPSSLPPSCSGQQQPPNSASSGPNPAPSGPNPTPTAGSGVNPQLLQQMLSGGGLGGLGAGGLGLGGTGSAGTPQQQMLGTQLQQAEVLYQSQLEQLQTMGFHNRQANLNGEY